MSSKLVVFGSQSHPYIKATIPLSESDYRVFLVLKSGWIYYFQAKFMYQFLLQIQPPQDIKPVTIRDNSISHCFSYNFFLPQKFSENWIRSIWFDSSNNFTFQIQLNLSSTIILHYFPRVVSPKLIESKSTSPHFDSQKSIIQPSPTKESKLKDMRLQSKYTHVVRWKYFLTSRLDLCCGYATHSCTQFIQSPPQFFLLLFAVISAAHTCEHICGATCGKWTNKHYSCFVFSSFFQFFYFSSLHTSWVLELSAAVAAAAPTG